jgi:large subunit ribosomal protein L20
MSRVKRGVVTRQRHNRVLKLAKGYRGAKHRLFRQAKESVAHAGQYAYRDRRTRKRNFRRLWIARINAAVRDHGLSYSRFMDGLTKTGSALDRKVLSDIAIQDPEGFAKIVQQAKAALGA